MSDFLYFGGDENWPHYLPTLAKHQEERDKLAFFNLLEEYKKYKNDFRLNLEFDPSLDTLSMGIYLIIRKFSVYRGTVSNFCRNIQPRIDLTHLRYFSYF